MTRPGLARRVFDRRTFVAGSAGALVGAVVPRPLFSLPSQQVANRNLVGPIDGYSPLMGTLVSMMNWMRPSVINAVEGLSREELDTLYDSESNTIGALLMHLGGTEVSYQRGTLGLRDHTRTERREWHNFEKKQGLSEPALPLTVWTRMVGEGSIQPDEIGRTVGLLRCA